MCFMKKINDWSAKMSLTKFEILSTVVEEGRLTKAAESLSMTQSAISHAISSLESEWGFSLLNRDCSGISLTSNGERVLKHVRGVLQDWELAYSQKYFLFNYKMILP